jgi:RNA polymerase sigma factor (sigma-70 family)
MSLRTRTAHASLTPRQRDILRLVQDGLTSREIAERLGIARPTVETHISAAMRKLGARTRRQALSLLDRTGST